MLEKFYKLKNQIKSKILFDHDIGKMTWFKTGGKAKIFILVEDENELEIIINTFKGMNFFIMGSGSNTLIRDKGYNGVIIKLGKGFNKLLINENKIEAGASILDINLSKFAENNSIKNFEFFSGIPGSIGGAIKMNAGCFGSETKDNLEKISVIDYKGNKIEINANKLDLKYRSSNIKETDIVTKAIFKIKYGNKIQIQEKINSIKSKRKDSQPLKEKTSGSTFKNPPNFFAAKLIEESGCKGLEIGDAMVSLHHSNFLINKGNASATDIEQLGKNIIDRVYDKFQIQLEWEIKIIGD
ncbi:MAG: UDP-N-acetylenolpyruvoylglucosamine reductase [Rickettsiales bacterium]|nr:UDP-N-acetylenolpyruvoylglucosamine reductase [Rickettsiales bacterium]